VVSQPLRNAGLDCLLALPKIVGVAAMTDLFERIAMPNLGHDVCANQACRYVYPTSFKIRAGQSVRIVLNASWWNPVNSESATPPPPPPPCASSIRDVNRVEFPLASGNLVIHWETVLREVCLSPASVSMGVETT
jgi:hypothetical protein